MKKEINKHMARKQNQNTNDFIKKGIYVITAIAAIITLSAYAYDLGSYVDPYVSSEQKSNLEVNIIVDPTQKSPKDSEFIFEFEICNKGDTGEQYNYSLKTNNIILKNDSGNHIDGNNDYGNSFLNDGEPCAVKEYIFLPMKKQTRYQYTKDYYSEISFSMNVYSMSKNKVIVDKSFKYTLDNNNYKLESLNS